MKKTDKFLIISEVEYYQLYLCYVQRVINGKVETLYGFLENEPIRLWYRSFWENLIKLPYFVRSEDQWITHAFTVVEDEVWLWMDDRKEGHYSFDSALAKETFLHACTPDEAAWVQKQC